MAPLAESDQEYRLILGCLAAQCKLNHSFREIYIWLMDYTYHTEPAETMNLLPELVDWIVQERRRKIDQSNFLDRTCYMTDVGHACNAVGIAYSLDEQRQILQMLTSESEKGA